MEIFEYKKTVMLIKYLSDSVIKMLDKKKHGEIRTVLKQSYDIVFFNVINKTSDFVDIMIKTRTKMRVYHITLEGEITLKGERDIVNVTQNS